MLIYRILALHLVKLYRCDQFDKKKKIVFIHVTNRVRGPYRKLRIFSLRFMAQARSARAINGRVKNEDPQLTYSRDREDEVSKIFIIFLLRV